MGLYSRHEVILEKVERANARMRELVASLSLREVVEPTEVFAHRFMWAKEPEADGVRQWVLDVQVKDDDQYQVDDIWSDVPKTTLHTSATEAALRIKELLGRGPKIAAPAN